MQHIVLRSSKNRGVSQEAKIAYELDIVYPSNERAESVLLSTVATSKRVHSCTVALLGSAHLVLG